MATIGYDYEGATRLTGMADVDLSANKGYAVGVNGTDIALLGDATTVPKGLLWDGGTGANTQCTYTALGFTPGKMAGVSAFGAQLASDAAGKLVTTVTLGNYIVAAYNETANSAANELRPVFCVAALQRRWSAVA